MQESSTHEASGTKPALHARPMHAGIIRMASSGDCRGGETHALSPLSGRAHLAGILTKDLSDFLWGSIYKVTQSVSSSGPQVPACGGGNTSRQTVEATGTERVTGPFSREQFLSLPNACRSTRRLKKQFCYT